MSELPPGFVLDQAVPELPPGFVLDKPGMLEDAAKSTGAGLASATAGTLGLAGDVRTGLSAVTDWAGGKLGASPDKVQMFKDMASKAAGMTGVGAVLNAAPTSRQIINSAPDPIVSPDYEPKTALGGVLKTGAEFLPGMIGGPEGALTKLATRVAVPAIGSEIGKEVGGPLGGVAGALLGGAGASKIANTLAETRAVRAAAPTLANVKDEATNTYNALTSRNVAIPLHQTTLDNLAGDIATTLNNRGIRPSNASSIHAAVDELKAPATKGAADVADLVAGRQSIKELLGKPDTNKAGAFVALGKIEAAIEQASPGTMAKIREADKNYGAGKAVEALDKKLARADLRAAGADSGMNIGNKIRQKVADLLLSSEAKYLSAETKADLEKIVRGTATQQIVRRIDRLLGGGGGLGMMAGGIGTGYAADGWQGAALGAAGAHGMRTIYNRSVMQNAGRASQNIRMRSPLGQQSPLVLPPMSNPLLSASIPALLARPKQ